MKKSIFSTILLLFSICAYTQDLPSTLKAALPYLKQKAAVKGIYETYAQQTLWTENGQLNAKGSKVWEILQNVEQYGLLPTQYQVAGIKLALTEQNNNLADVFLTDGLALLCQHLNSGAVNPVKIQKNIVSANKGNDLAAILENAYAAQDLFAYLESIQPQYAGYKKLLKTLNNYREFAQKGGWTKLPANITQLPKEQAAVLLTERLVQSNDWNPNMLITDPEYTLTDAVSQYQRTHALPQTRILDAATIASINVPVENRIAKIKLSLERFRWLPTNPAEEYILVNLPAYRAVFMENNEMLIKTNVIVGAAKTATPLIVSKASRIVINPTWTVPYSIAINEILPKLNEQPTYLKINDMDLLDANGNIVTLTDAQIKALTRETFRYDIRQRASEDNSLGRYVLYFPNKHFIYMHDTNAPYLFEKEKRALSHGCIRTQEIERICKYLIENNSDTSIETAKAAYDNKETLTVPLRDKIDVYIQYFTVWAEAEDVYFLNDVYGYDKQLSPLMAK